MFCGLKREFLTLQSGGDTFPYLCLAREHKNNQSPTPLDIKGQKQEWMEHSRRVSRGQTLNPE